MLIARSNICIETVQAESNTRSDSNTNVDEGSIPTAFTKEVERHKYECTHHACIGILEHALEDQALGALEVDSADVSRTLEALTLGSNGDDKVNQRALEWALA